MSENQISLIYDSQDIQAGLRDVPKNVIGNHEEISAIAVMAVNGEISDMWVCRSSRPYDRFAEFEGVLVRGEFLHPINQFYTTVEQIEEYATKSRAAGNTAAFGVTAPTAP